MTFSAAGRTSLPRVAWPSRWSMVQDAALVVVAALFVYAHATRLVVHGEWTSLIFALEQSMLVVMFLARRRSKATSIRVSDWVVAAIGGWLPLALRPAHSSISELAIGGVGIQLIGGCLTLVAFAYLGRSFGVVAANRGLKVGGPYRLVRHPIYATHLITTSGFLMANPSLLNGVLVGIITAAQLARIRSEERLLTATANYSDYKSQVRWRLLPGLF